MELEWLPLTYRYLEGWLNFKLNHNLSTPSDTQILRGLVESHSKYEKMNNFNINMSRISRKKLYYIIWSLLERSMYGECHGRTPRRKCKNNLKWNKVSIKYFLLDFKVGTQGALIFYGLIYIFWIDGGKFQHLLIRTWKNAPVTYWAPYL